jgi:SH3 domain protein
MYQRLIVLLLACLVFSSHVFAARSVHITDKLIAGLFKARELTGDPLRLLPSGTPLEIVKSTSSATLVKTSDGTQGWVETRYLSNKKSSKVTLMELQIKHRGIIKEIDSKNTEIAGLKVKLREATAKVKLLDGQLKNRTDNTKAQVAKATKDVKSLKAQLKNAREEIAKLKKSVSSKSSTGSVVTKTVVDTKQVDTLKEKIILLEKQLTEAKTPPPATSVIEAVTEDPEQIPSLSGSATKKLNAELAELKAKNQVLSEKLQQIAGIVGTQVLAPESSEEGMPMYWLLVILSVMLMLGFVGGIGWLDFRQRRRHGGFRV